MDRFKNIKAYIAAQPAERRGVLNEMYEVVKAAAPKAIEDIKYGMPTLVGKGNLVHFAAMRGHLGFYPAPSAIQQFATELSEFSASKGCVRIPYDKPLPKSLITKMVKFRVKEDKGVLG